MEGRSVLNVNTQEYRFEISKLDHTKASIKAQLEALELSHMAKADEIVALKRELREESNHQVGDLYSADGFADFVEMSQFSNPITQKVDEYEKEIERIDILEKMLNSPYFARLGFKYEDEAEFEDVYIGRASVMDDATKHFEVYDWRAPIASLYYRFGTGKVHYDAPMGKIDGEVNLKRQFEIKQGHLNYFFDAEVGILDEFLRRLLSQNASPKMKTIVETIQMDQDVIIRDLKKDLIIVQGVAGSGKTSVALHRVAYLMYHGLSYPLSPNNIVILSPNTLFEQSISNVLPELGEKNVASYTFEELFPFGALKGHLQTKNQYLESILSPEKRFSIPLMKSSMAFKGSSPYVGIMKALVTDINKIVKAMERVYNRDKIIERTLTEQYKKMYSDRSYFKKLAKESMLPEDIDAIISYTDAHLSKDRTLYEDAIALNYCYLLLLGGSEMSHIRHIHLIKQVVIDEAQDYSEIQFEILNLLFPRARFTVLGDINQTIGKQESLALYERFMTILDKSNASLVTLNKSFRNTSEILAFSTQFLQEEAEIQSFNRSGEAPSVISAEHSDALNQKILEEIQYSKEKQYQSIALICKNAKDAAQLYESLKSKIDIKLIDEECLTEAKGTFIIPITLSKGLEFDAVLIYGVDATRYHSEEDKRLLYIASTRALHRLNLFYHGKRSPLL